MASHQPPVHFRTVSYDRTVCLLLQDLELLSMRNGSLCRLPEVRIKTSEPGTYLSQGGGTLDRIGACSKVIYNLWFVPARTFQGS